MESRVYIAIANDWRLRDSYVNGSVVHFESCRAGGHAETRVAANLAIPTEVGQVL